MSPASVTRASVLAAIREYDALGRDAFLAKYGYGRSNRYVLVHRGRKYDSKAILGVADGYARRGKPLAARDFSGGAEHCARVLLRLGFDVHRDGERLTERVVRCVLRLFRCARRTVAALTRRAQPLVVGLVSCTKAKLDRPAPARELYSPSYVFRLSVLYVEARCDEWRVLSAEHGVVHPTDVLAPYDKTLSKMRAHERRVWATAVCKTLRRLYEQAKVRFVVLAGRLYAQALEQLGFPAEIEEPLKGMSTGRRRQWLALQTKATA